ncbi:unnamed protein product [Cylindrotheca closterium]|uniref:Fatty acid desaturase domain-containing protein n=1 Tax=Cylindrotheca closterium TaxID=2856 RepID=A0AAD2JG92_9STRA|nr:unnamed protein product [Cylindrotheca closterium]
MKNHKSKRNGKERTRPVSRLMMILFCIQLIQTSRIGLVEGFCPRVVATIQSKASLNQRFTITLSASNPSFDSIESSSSASGVDHNADKAAAVSYSNAAEWHRQRRKQMIQKYGDQILPLEQQTSSYNLGIPLLLVGNLILMGLSLQAAKLPIKWVFGLALFPGSILSLWQLQILHDGLHGSLFPIRQHHKSKIWGFWGRKQWQDMVLFWGSMPSVFGYYLYLKFGHLAHHVNLGDAQKVSLAKLFDSNQTNFEDGDILFVSHRMKLLGKIGPTFSGKLPSIFNFRRSRDDPNDRNEERQYSITMSLSRTGFDNWKTGKAIRNIGIFATSFLFERLMLVINDAAVSLSGFNAFFPNKPKSFHDECAKYARCATLLRLGLWWLGSWKSLLFLYLSETLWSIPPHPASAMFVTNHPSIMNKQDSSSSTTTSDEWSCTPSQSTYLGRWYSLLTLGTNYHCEHHDFPTIPLHKLSLLHQIAPEFYPKSNESSSSASTSASSSRNSLRKIWKKSFADPDYYACMNSNIIV